MIRKSHLSKLGRSHSQPIPFHMVKTLCITLTGKAEGDIVRLADEPVYGGENVTFIIS